MPTQLERAVKRTHLQHRYSRAVSRAKYRKLTFDISIGEFEGIIESPCTYCQGDILGEGGGMDRLDNKRGYYLDNVTPSCQDCNRIRSNEYTPDEMKKLIGPALRLVRFFRSHKFSIWRKP